MQRSKSWQWLFTLPKDEFTNAVIGVPSRPCGGPNVIMEHDPVLGYRILAKKVNSTWVWIKAVPPKGWFTAFRAKLKVA